MFSLTTLRCVRFKVLFLLSFFVVSILMFSCTSTTTENQSLSTPYIFTDELLSPDEPVEHLPSITITPSFALIDEPVSIIISHLSPSEIVTVVATTRLNSQGIYESWASFKANAEGTVNVGEQSPIRGTYQGVDPMGLFWSMEARRDIDPSFTLDLSVPCIYNFEIKTESNVVATVQIERMFMLPNVSEIAITEDGINGTLFMPGNGKSYPAIIMLGGSDGGALIGQAALLASHGYATLALSYFGHTPLPRQLVEIPLEYFGNAIQWLKHNPYIDSEQIAVLGVSRGGELALLIGATYPEVNAVIGYSASGVMWQGINLVSEDEASAWSLANTPLPFIPLRRSDEFQAYVNEQTAYNMPVEYNSLFIENMENNTNILEQATIAVENINGPVMLISGQEDKMWPSEILSEIAVQRLSASSDYTYDVLFLRYPGAGHDIGIPYMPTTKRDVYHPHTRELLALGGNAQETAFASIDSWQELLIFLDKYLMKP